MTSEDKLLHDIHRIKRRVGHLASRPTPADSKLLSEVLEEVASALTEVHEEIAALKASRPG